MLDATGGLPKEIINAEFEKGTKKVFLEKYPSLKEMLEDRDTKLEERQADPNDKNKIYYYLEIKDPSKYIDPNKNPGKVEPITKGTQREVLDYHPDKDNTGVIIKSLQKGESYENLRDDYWNNYPVTEPIALLKTGSEDTVKYYIFEEKATPVKKYFEEFIKNKPEGKNEVYKKFKTMFREFSKNWQEHNNCPSQFDEISLENHLLIAKRNNIEQMIMTDVNLLGNIPAAKEGFLKGLENNKRQESILENIIFPEIRKNKIIDDELHDLRHEIGNKLQTPTGYIDTIIRQGGKGNLNYEEQKSLLSTIKHSLEGTTSQEEPYQYDAGLGYQNKLLDSYSNLFKDKYKNKFKDEFFNEYKNELFSKYFTMLKKIKVIDEKKIYSKTDLNVIKETCKEFNEFMDENLFLLKMNEYQEAEYRK